MSTILQGVQNRQLILGSLVTKAAANLPQSATGTLFTVTGGLVIVTSLVGVVTTVIQSSDPQLSLGTAPTAGTLETSGVATTTAITSAEVGTLVTIGSSAGLPTALVVMAASAKAGNAVFLTGDAFVANTGTITWTTGASKTGALKWYLTYIPLDAGAYVS